MEMPYTELDPYTRCYAMVGQFLSHWAAMENQLNDAIGVALELKGLQRYIVTKNIQFRDKIKILKACAAVAFHDEKERKAVQKILTSIGEYSHKRNMIAHDMFMPPKHGDGVEFLRVVANDRVDLSSVVWTAKDFEAAYTQLTDFTLAGSGIEQKLKSAHSFRRIMEALIRQPDLSPSEDTEGLSPLARLFLQPLADLNSPPEQPTQPTTLQTPEEHQEKE